VPVHGADADAGDAGDLGVLHLIGALGEQGARRFQHALAVALGVGARLAISGRRWR
jgi:hypothetical protein